MPLSRGSARLLVLAALFMAGLLTAAYLFAMRPNNSAKPEEPPKLISADAAPLYWEAIADADEHSNLVYDRSIDPRNANLKRIIKRFRDAARMPECKPVASEGRSLGKFLEGLKTGARLIGYEESQEGQMVQQSLELASIRMKMAEHATIVKSGRKTGEEIEDMAIDAWWGLMREFANDRSVLDRGQKWLDETGKPDNAEWVKRFPHHRLGQAAISVLRFRLDHEGRLPKDLKQIGAPATDAASGLPYVYEMFQRNKDESQFFVYLGPKVAKRDTWPSSSELVFNTWYIGRRREWEKQFSDSTSSAAKPGSGKAVLRPK